MKQLTNYQRASQYLVKIFKEVNTFYFNNELEAPTITIQTSRGAYGHVTTSKVWVSEEATFSYELNIGAEYLTRPIEQVVATIIHECCHLYALKYNIKDTSNRGVYHNKKFRDIAISKDLEIEHHPKYGYTITKPTVELLMFCEEHNFQDIQIQRGLGLSLIPKGNNPNGSQDLNPKPTSSTRKYQCPSCGNSFRATKDINVLCMDCNVQFIKV